MCFIGTCPHTLHSPLLRLDSPQKGTYALGLPLSTVAGPSGLVAFSLYNGLYEYEGVLGMTTFMASADRATPGYVESRWHLIDADGRALGRLATVAAHLLQGKHKPQYTPFVDTGAHVAVVN